MFESPRDSAEQPDEHTAMTKAIVIVALVWVRYDMNVMLSSCFFVIRVTFRLLSTLFRIEQQVEKSKV